MKYRTTRQVDYKKVSKCAQRVDTQQKNYRIFPFKFSLVGRIEIFNRSMAIGTGYMADERITVDLPAMFEKSGRQEPVYYTASSLRHICSRKGLGMTDSSQCN